VFLGQVARFHATSRLFGSNLAKAGFHRVADDPPEVDTDTSQFDGPVSEWPTNRELDTAASIVSNPLRDPNPLQ
jgi:hypothetical protein